MAMALKLGMLILMSLLVASEQKGQLVAYWGQSDDEGSLLSACTSGGYDIVVISFLCEFGRGTEPVLNLAGHCDVPSGGCKQLSTEIKACQGKGVTVLLSIGGAGDTYSLNTPKAANDLALYLWNNYLGGKSNSRPLGDARLDGIDFDIEHGGFQQYATLANKLKALGSDSVILSAAPQCPFEDASLGPGKGSALSTGHFDFVWVQFYNNEACHYDFNKKDISRLIEAWNNWATKVPATKILLGLPASPAAATDTVSFDSGFVPPQVLINQILPKIKNSKSYGGVMLWSVFYDKEYSKAIKSSI